MGAVEGFVFVVDVVEGAVAITQTRMQALKDAEECGLKPVLCINKMDRIFIELRLDGEECYETLRRTIDTVAVNLPNSDVRRCAFSLFI